MYKNAQLLHFPVISIDLFNNRKNDRMTAWEEEKRRRMPKRFFLNGCTG
jgi:hypothetical protein